MIDIPKGATMSAPDPLTVPKDALAALRASYKERRAANIWPTKRGGSLTKAGADAAFDWLVGASDALSAVGYKGLGGWLFVAMVRGPDEVMLKEV